MSKTAETGNAADPRQVKDAGRRERRRTRDFDNALRAVLDTPDGRLVLWQLLSMAGIYRSCYDNSGSRTYWNVGRQDYGHELLAHIIEASPQLYALMEREARERDARTDAEREAAQVPSSDQGAEQ